MIPAELWTQLGVGATVVAILYVAVKTLDGRYQRAIGKIEKEKDRQIDQLRSEIEEIRSLSRKEMTDMIKKSEHTMQQNNLLLFEVKGVMHEVSVMLKALWDRNIKNAKPK